MWEYYRDYIGMMEKKMEATTCYVSWVLPPPTNSPGVIPRALNTSIMNMIQLRMGGASTQYMTSNKVQILHLMCDYPTTLAGSTGRCQRAE